MRIEKEYEANRRSKYEGQYESTTTYYEMRHCTKLIAPISLKASATLVSAAALSTILLVLPAMIFFIMLVPIVFSFLYLNNKIWNNLKVDRVNTYEIGKNLRDEGNEVCKTYANLKVAADLSPEGSGIQARTYEFGSLVFHTIKTLTGLREVNEIMNGSEKSFYHELVKFKNQLGELDNSGRSLIEMTASRRLDSVKQDMKFIGIQEFNEAISNETAIYRALSSGDDM